MKISAWISFLNAIHTVLIASSIVGFVVLISRLINN